MAYLFVGLAPFGQHDICDLRIFVQWKSLFILIAI